MGSDPTAGADELSPDTTIAATNSGYGGDSVAGLPYNDADVAQELSAAAAAQQTSQKRASRNKRAAVQPKAKSAPAKVAAKLWVNPVPTAKFTSCFCARWGTFHEGIDLAAPLGTPIQAAGAGVVLKAGPASGFGNAIYIQHANGDVTVYGHMRVLWVTTGQTVKVGQKIAEVGSEGYSTGPHLHFEVHVGKIDGAKINPVSWLAARGIKVGP
jgi:murein DD-endopeptidase MepM/ murein hydrolase activator NlpD